MVCRASLQDSVVALALVAATVAVTASAYNDDRPIFKWSPNFFNGYYRRSMYKRFNEDQPYYKWSPRWFSRYAGTFKRSVPEPVEEPGACGEVAAECRLLAAGRQDSCCGGLTCTATDDGPRCLSNYSLSFGDQLGESSAEEDAFRYVKPFWYKSGPTPFFPRSWV